MADDPKLDASTMDASKPLSPSRPSPVLHVVFSADAVVHRSLRLRGETLAGRKVDGDLAFPEDGQASRVHARFVARGSAVSVEDLDSRNGVHVNGKRVSRADLGDGDVVRIGSTFAVLRLEDPQQLDVPDDRLLGVSAQMRAVRVAVKRVAKSDATVLVHGETGTGKEVVAESLHRQSGRPGAYVAVNCAAVPATLFESQLFGHVAGAFTGARDAAEGFFRAAKQGTLLLDEVGDLPLDLQPKLLRALETGAVVPVGATASVPHHARVVSASHVDLRNTGFREDLYARLAQLHVALPPLRERREDILLLLERHLGESPPLAPSLVEALLIHDYRRNVRELLAIAAELHTFASADRLELDMVKGRLTPRASDSRESTPLSDPEDDEPPDAETLAALLKEHGGNITAVARAVHRSRTQVYRLLELHRLDPARFRTS